jgi:hypothetical protein
LLLTIADGLQITASAEKTHGFRKGNIKVILIEDFMYHFGEYEQAFCAAACRQKFLLVDIVRLLRDKEPEQLPS